MRALPAPTVCERGLFAMFIFVVEVLFSYSYCGEDTFFKVCDAFYDEYAAERWGCDAPARLTDAQEQVGSTMRHLVRAEGEVYIRRIPLY